MNNNLYSDRFSLLKFCAVCRDGLVASHRVERFNKGELSLLCDRQVNSVKACCDLLASPLCALEMYKLHRVPRGWERSLHSSPVPTLRQSHRFLFVPGIRLEMHLRDLDFIFNRSSGLIYSYLYELIFGG